MASNVPLSTSSGSTPSVCASVATPTSADITFGTRTVSSREPSMKPIFSWTEEIEKEYIPADLAGQNIELFKKGFEEKLRELHYTITTGPVFRSERDLPGPSPQTADQPSAMVSTIDEGSVQQSLSKQKKQPPIRPFSQEWNLAVATLKAWFDDRVTAGQTPGPSQKEKQELMNQTGMTMVQISCWFNNERRRRDIKLRKRLC